MILAGLTLLTIGVADLIRQFAPRGWRWPLIAATGALILALGICAAAPVQAIAAIAVAAGWLWLLPLAHVARAGAWPAIGVGVVCIVATVAAGPRPDAGILGAVWRLPSPIGEVAFDRAVLAVGALVFLMESANIIVRVALTRHGEPTAVDDPAAGRTEPTTADEAMAAPLPDPPQLRGGRLIGPLERILMLVLTLASAYTLVAAFVAAKGIVRFPEISHDGTGGTRAEYFLVGSMVSWVIALTAALLIWWGTAG